MTLSSKDKLNLIKDILNSHQMDRNPTVSEYEQLFRSTNQLLQQQDSPELNDIIQAINEYSEAGLDENQSNEHLDHNTANINQWIQSLG
ncbi:YtzH-like family protein [Tuberibacillus sp. Marseille-P3662]|uniref:YtzH-like family protein n=1 Tax=Tuberibacillus sp. Marseille-P3662 TaxID=1965358 RepID=UPI000A1CA484|nr:YtzH-like family protein [Tuberibacillus sp. Marseille-P3662]